jgi:cbb3-type cytochrome oxidase subunit 3
METSPPSGPPPDYGSVTHRHTSGFVVGSTFHYRCCAVCVTHGQPAVFYCQSCGETFCLRCGVDKHEVTERDCLGFEVENGHTIGYICQVCWELRPEPLMNKVQRHCNPWMGTLVNLFWCLVLCGVILGVIFWLFWPASRRRPKLNLVLICHRLWKINFNLIFSVLVIAHWFSHDAKSRRTPFV